MKIEIKVMWCKGLTAFNFFQKLTIYTSVSIKCEDQRLELTDDQKQEQKTPVDEDGDGDPEWNHTILFDLTRLESVRPNFEDLSVDFEVRHRGQLFGDKTVGEVRVPLRSLIESVGGDVVRFVSYEVRSPDGKHNGILDFSYKIIRHDDALVSYNQNNYSDNNSSEIQISGYNNNQTSYGQIVQHHHQHYDANQQSSSSDIEKIEYPKIDWNASDSTLVAINTSHYPPPELYPPHLQHQPYQPPYFPPPPPAPPVVYPPPPHLYGDSHWGYYRPPDNYRPNGGFDGYRRW
ncbi:hypothetical protein RND81_13G155100 [Saponaria officinalis]|uniref:C2 domain-containing protein n=1 Tax=Saponaria officinalis TaxID=3572 RepID=A0AAW1H134_SAPOF